MPTPESVDSPRRWAFLAVLLVGTLVVDFLLYAVPDWTLPNGVQGVAPVFMVVVAAGVIMWVRAPSSAPAPRVVAAALICWLVIWLVWVGEGVLRGDAPAVNAVMVPVALLLVLGKPPTGAAALRAGDALGLAVVLGAVLALVLEVTGVVPSWYRDAPVGMADYDRATYWLPLADLLGLDGRWAGPFDNPNLAGPAGALLLVYGVGRRGWVRWLFSVTGVAMLLLTSSRTSLIAAAAGVAVLAATWWLRHPGRLPRSWRVALLALPPVLLIVTVVRANPGLTGRTTVWPTMVELWQQSPWVGIGQTGFDAAIEAGTLPPWAHHAHNVWFDSLVRLGVVGAILVTALAVIALLATALPLARGGSPAGVALIATLAVGSLTDTNLHWPYLTVPAAFLLVALLIAQPDPPRRTPPRVRRSEGQLRPVPGPGSDQGRDREPSSEVG
jgi:O-antigen ligase